MSDRLEKEVWALDKCAGCGICVALCSKGVTVWNGGEHPTTEKREKTLGLSRTTLDTCTFCQKFCEEACPRLQDEWKALPLKGVVAAQATGIVQSGEPGDIIKHLLVAGIASGLLDGVVLLDLDPWTLKPVAKVLTSVGDVVDTMGVQYIWGPVMDALNEAVYTKGLKRLAVVGTPCVAQAVRRLMASENERLSIYKDAIRVTISTFCTGVYMPELVHTYLQESLGIAPQSVKRLQVSSRQETLTAELWDGSTKTVPLAEVEKYTRHGCARCDDYLGESADIAVGTVGAKADHSTVITRTTAGDVLLQNAIGFGFLETGDGVDKAALTRASEGKERRKRAQEFDKMVVMMLDAQGDPRQRAAVRQAFVRLYEPRRPSNECKEEANCHATCGQC